MTGDCVSTMARLHLSTPRLRTYPLNTASHPLLPFLYETRTILRHYAVDAFNGHSDSPSRKTLGARKRIPRTEGRRKSIADQDVTERDLADRLGRPHQYSSTRVDSVQRTRLEDSGISKLSIPPYPRSIAQSDPSKKVTRPDYVPFEVNGVASRHFGSTITESEHKAFERLFEEKVKRGGFDDEEMDLQQLIGNESKELRVEELAESRDAPNELGLPVGGSPNNLIDPETKSHGHLDHRYEDRLARLSELRELVDKAETDQELWQILHERIFAQLKALELDNPEVNAVRERRRRQIWKENLERSKIHDASRNESSVQFTLKEDTLDTWAAILPQLLVHIIDCLSQRFPRSSLSAALLPALREQGPSEFALGASTALYNRHMRLLWERYCDLPGICRTLEEMDRAVFSFNTSTLALIGEILSRSQLAYRGQLGAGQQLLWGSERRSRHWRKLGSWKEILRTRLIEERFRKARQEQIGSIEGVDELDATQLVT